MKKENTIIVTDITIIDDQLTVFFQWEEKISETEIRNVLFGTEYVVDKSPIYTTFKNKLNKFIDKDMAKILQDNKEKLDISKFISKTIMSGRYKGNRTPSYDVGLPIIKDIVITDSKNDIKEIHYDLLEINMFQVEKEVTRIAMDIYKEHIVYTTSGLSVYKKIPLKLIGNFNGGISEYDISLSLDLKIKKYYIEQPNYYENFKFMGMIPSNLKLSEAKDSDFIIIKDNEEYKEFLMKEVDRLNEE